MNIAVVGAGYVGLVSAACFCEFGFRVSCVERDPDRLAQIKRGESPVFEPGLKELLMRHLADGDLIPTDDMATAILGAEAVFVTVGTPTRRGDGAADMTYVLQAAAEIARAATAYTVVVIKSTVPVGANRQVHEAMVKANPNLEFDVVSNPEFLREGDAIKDFMEPDRVVIGVETPAAAKVMSRIYQPLRDQGHTVVTTGIETAEMIKYAANGFLATKITFINEIAALCDQCGADVKKVAEGIGYDNRISRHFLRAGPGFGGSCFPKDALALARLGRDHGTPITVMETVLSANNECKRRAIHKLREFCGGSFQDQRIAVLGVTFKPGTDDMRDAPSLTLIPAMLEEGADVQVTDPQGQTKGKALLPGVAWVDDAYLAAQGSDCVVLLTEWPEFARLDLARLAKVTRTPRFADMRNIHAPEDVRASGFTAYTSIGHGGFRAPTRPDG